MTKQKKQINIKQEKRKEKKQEKNEGGIMDWAERNFDTIQMITSIICLIGLTLLLPALFKILNSAKRFDDESMIKFLGDISMNHKEDSAKSLKLLSAYVQRVHANATSKQILLDKSQERQTIESLRSGILLRTKQCSVKHEYINLMLNLTHLLISEGNDNYRCENDYLFEILTKCDDNKNLINSAYSIFSLLINGKKCHKKTIKELVAYGSEQENLKTKQKLLQLMNSSNDENVCTLVENIVDYINEWEEDTNKVFCGYAKTHKCEVFDSLDMNAICNLEKEREEL
ncbi:hypothetical protein GPJ56_004161 [Histomonas meleagridis]|uniref:uncharacterized protein n=1 Tax=Histomonas meleagridis TaxID=135588 RepID=UPI00355A4AA3|nr:hypothetical protein GPJ56_004161 [Histomonas meleagridis]KAH0801502.1 hypothetical protein GO595_005754 [Histomonas meleagridis]